MSRVSGYIEGHGPDEHVMSFSQGDEDDYVL